MFNEIFGNSLMTDKNVTAHRVNQILKYLSLGLPKRDIFDSLQKTQAGKWDISYRQFQNLAKKAENIIEKGLQRSNLYYLNRGIERYDLLYAKLWASENFSGAAQIQKMLEGLLKLGSYSDDKGVSVNLTNQIMFGNIPVNQELLSKLKKSDV